MIAVVFHENSNPEIVRSDKGIRFIVSDLLSESVSSVYFAKSEADAKLAIQALDNKEEQE